MSEIPTLSDLIKKIDSAMYRKPRRSDFTIKHRNLLAFAYQNYGDFMIEMRHTPLQLLQKCRCCGRRTETYGIIQAILPSDLAEIVHEYMLPLKYSDRGIAASGYFELCSFIRTDDGLLGACDGGHLEILQCIIKRLQASNPPVPTSPMLHGISKHTISRALNISCKKHYLDIIKLLVNYGARSCPNCRMDARDHY